MRFFLVMIFSLSIFLNINASELDIISRYSDSSFGGFYLNIEKTMKKYNISRLVAHEIQNRMRDYLEEKARSYSRVEQKRYLNDAINFSLSTVIKQQQNEGGYKPITFKKNEFVVALDLDETLLSHWYKAGAYKIGTFSTNMPDTVPSFVDRKSGNSKNPELLVSSSYIQTRPNVFHFLNSVSKISGFKGFIIFTAKEDKAAWSIYNKWKKISPQIFKNIIGFYTRNYLKFQKGFNKPSKDLRIFDPNLEHVILIDDNESRIIQKHLNYKIPKFNADQFIKYASNKNSLIRILNYKILEHIYDQIFQCSSQLRFINCFVETLGKLSLKEDGEINLFLRWFNYKYGKNISTETIKKYKVFNPIFQVHHFIKLNEHYPMFKNGILIE